MDTLSDNKLEGELDQAKRVIAELQLPPEVERLSVTIGSDAAGESALWLHLHVKPEVQPNPDEVRRLTDFARKVQAAIIDSGITLFPYTSLEQVA